MDPRSALAIVIALAACESSVAPAPVERVAVGTARPELRADPREAAVDLAPRAPAPTKLDDLCGPIAEATCRVHLGCRTGVTRDSLLACETQIRATCELERPRLEARVDAGLLRFDRAALRECQTTLSFLECDAPAAMMTALGAACDAVLVGRLGEDAACSDAGDCAPGLACMSAGTCPGRCEPLRKLGASCNAELAPCAESLSCEAGRCAPASVALGETCVSSAQCPTTAFCSDRGTCEDKRVTGAACDDDEQCRPDDHCRMWLDAELGLGACTARLALGAPCDPLVGGCAAGLACDETRGVCATLPDVVGEGCVEGASPCGEGTGMQCDAGLCELEPFAGDPCDPANAAAACRFGYCAPTEASGLFECRAFRAPLEACDADLECGSLACVDGRCARPEARCNAALRDINLGFRFRIR
jgi:hypothetical protein